MVSRHSLKGNYPFVILVALIAILSLWLFTVLRDLDYQRIERSFETDAEHRYETLKLEIDLNLHAVSSLRALYASDSDVKETEFSTFARHLLSKNPSIQALGWIPRVPGSQRSSYEAHAAGQLHPVRQITERDGRGRMIRAGGRDQYFPVGFVEPYEGNEPALGFDLASDPERKAALDAARDTGNLVASQRIQLVQDKAGQYGFLVVGPVYRGTPADSVEARRRGLQGFVLGVFRCGDVVAAASLTEESTGTALTLYDITAPSDEQLLYHRTSQVVSGARPGAPGKPASEPPLQYSKILDVAQRQWRMALSADASYISANRSWHPWGGLLAGFLLGALIINQLLAGGRHIRSLAAVNADLRNEVIERRRTEDSLRESEAKFRSYIERSPLAVFVADQEGRIIEVNHSATELTGYDTATLLKMPVWELHAAEDREVVLNEFETLARDGRVEGEYRFRRKDGSLIWVSLKAAMIGDRVSLAYCTDISDRKRAEEALRRYELLSAHSRDIMLFVRKDDGRVLDANAAAEKAYGYSHEGLLGLTVTDLRAPETLVRVQHDLDEADSGGTLFETVHRRSDGSTFPVEVSARGATIGGVRTLVSVVRDITERKQAEKALRESESKFRDFAERSTVGIYLIQGGVFKYVNARFAEITGYPVREIIDVKGPSHLVLPEDLPLLLENAEIGRREESGSIHDEFRIATKQWEIRQVEIYGSSTTYGGKPAMIGTLIDITERKATEEVLREKTAFLEALIHSSMDGIFVDDDNRRKIFKNQRYIDLRKLPPHLADEESDEKMLEYCSETTKNREEFIQKVEQLYSHPYESSLDEIELTDGTVLERYSAPVVKDGRHYGRIWTFHDITHRKLTEESLRRSEATMRSILSASPIGIAVQTAERTMQWFNASMSSITGYTQEEVKTYGARKVYESDEEFQRVKEVVWGEIEKGLVGSTDTRWIRKDGTAVDIHLSVAPIDPNDISLGVVTTATDITSRKRAEEALRKNEHNLRTLLGELELKNRELEDAYNELKESQKKIIQQEKMASIGQLAAGVAHEINNPTAFVMSNLHTLQKYLDRVYEFVSLQSEAVGAGDEARIAMSESVAERRRSLKIDYILDDSRNLIRESIEGEDRVKRIVQDLKDFSRIDGTNRTPADINNILDTTLNIVWNELKYKATVTKEYGELPPVVCNAGELSQVFMNILVNAAQAMEDHGEITISTSGNDKYVRVAISDTGCGIPQGQLDKVFEPFFTTKEIGKGTGLGLSIAYDIVKKHNGEIDVESKVGKGTTFVVKIPYKEM